MGKRLSVRGRVYALSLVATAYLGVAGYSALALQADGQPQKVVKTVTGDTAVVPPDHVIKQAENLDMVTDDRFFASLANAIGQSSGASALALIGIIAQLLIQFTKTPMFGRIFRKVDGRGKIAIVCTLTCVTTYVGLVSQGMGPVAALTSGGFMSVAMLAGHQLFAQFVKEPIAAKKEEKSDVVVG